MTNHGKESVALHQRHHGKLEVRSKVPLSTRHDLSLAYTPGVAQVCTEIANDPALARTLTLRGNTVAVVTDGSAILGLGNLGALAAMPVMEGKAVLFKELAGVDAFPLCLATQDASEIVATVKAVAPSFGAILLEDIASPRCFEVESRLQELGIPVMHDDQHGTAMVLLAALINALKVSPRDLSNARVVVNGSGASAIACVRLLVSAAEKGVFPRVGEIVMCDTKGVIHAGRTDLNTPKQQVLRITNPRGVTGTLADAMVGASIFIGLSSGDCVTQDMVRSMAPMPMVFAMANPTPEIMPLLAREAGAVVVGTGRSDFPNQVNNALAFPGVFRGALDVGARVISDGMKLAAARALAACVENPTADRILPDPLDRTIAHRVAQAVARQAVDDGVNTLPMVHA